jgi:hypothetical protein
MPTFTLKPIGGNALYVICAVVSYEQNRGIGGDISFEELCSGYHVFADRESIYYTKKLSEAFSFVEQKITELNARRNDYINLKPSSEINNAIQQE